MRNSIIISFCILLAACGGSSDSTTEINLYVNTNQQTMGLCTHTISDSQEDYDLAISNGMAPGKCPTENLISYCDLSGANNGNGTEVYYYSNETFGHDIYEQGCENLGGSYSLDIQGSNNHETGSVDIENVPMLSTNVMATEYQNYVTIGRTGIAEVWNIQAKRFEKFTDTNGLESYGSFNGHEYKMSVFRENVADGTPQALYGFNHSTGQYNQVSDTKWSNNEVCISGQYFDNGIIISGKENSASSCWNGSSYGYYIDVYSDATKQPISISFVDDIYYSRVKSLTDLNGKLKAYINSIEKKIHVLNNNQFTTYNLDSYSNIEAIKYISDENILLHIGNDIYQYSLSDITKELAGKNITDSLTSGENLSRIYMTGVSGNQVLVLVMNTPERNSYYYNINNDGTFTRVADLEAPFGSRLLSTSSYYVTAAFSENVDRYFNSDSELRPTVSYKYFDRETGIEDVSKRFASDINGSGCLVQGNNEFAVLHDNHVSIINDDATLNTALDTHLFTLHEGELDGTADFILTKYADGSTTYTKDGTDLGNLSIQIGKDPYSCFQGFGTSVNNSFYAKTNQISSEHFLFGDLTDEVKLH